MTQDLIASEDRTRHFVVAWPWSTVTTMSEASSWKLPLQNPVTSSRIFEGSVAGPDSKPVPGAPVFLWPVTEAARRSIGGARQILADSSGYYQFDGLPPGDYRVLATFDLSEVDEEILDAARAPVTRLDIGQRMTADLALWIAP